MVYTWCFFIWIADNNQTVIVVSILKMEIMVHIMGRTFHDMGLIIYEHNAAIGFDCRSISMLCICFFVRQRMMGESLLAGCGILIVTW
jgi:hypothetical protein